MSSEFLGVRLNAKKHKEIITWLNKFEDKSDEVRRLLALGINVSKGKVSTRSAPERNDPIVWSSIPKEPSVMQPLNKISLVNNILGSFED